jgi:hypothetical protein
MKPVSEISDLLRAIQNRDLKGWSDRNKENYATVWSTLNRCHRFKRPPKGEVGKRILSKLRRDLGEEFF